MRWFGQYLHVAKGIGLALLVYYFSSHPPTFGVWWVLFYLGILLACTGTWFLLSKLIFSLIQKARPQLEAKALIVEGKTPAGSENEAPIISQIVDLSTHPVKALRELILLPGEDGLFFVPLLLIGLNPITALVFVGLFGLAHVGQYQLSHVVIKTVSYYLVIVFVLPHGLLNIIIGHVIVDSVALLVARHNILTHHAGT